LANLDAPRALDLLYKIWTGSKDRTETTRLAESLLLAKDVRPRVSPSLEVALSLRDKPTACLVVRQLVERALTDADRRSAMLLVGLGAQQNCGDQQSMECPKCSEDSKLLRRATKEAAARPDPIS
jgi:hypothetical protein